MKLFEILKKVTVVVVIGIAGLASADNDIYSRYNFGLLEPDYNIKLGELRLDVIYETKIESDDNINRSPANDNRENGVMLSNALRLKVFWPIMPEFILNTDIALGYRSYHGANGPDGFFFDTSEMESITADWRINSTTLLSIIDRFGFNIESVESLRDNSIDLKTFTNSFAIQLEKAFTDTSFATIKLGRDDFKTIDSKAFEYRDRNVHYITLNYMRVLREDMRIGPYLTYRDTKFDKQDNSDLKTWEFGLDLQIDLGPRTTLAATIGYQSMELEDNSGSGLIGDLNLTNHFTDSITQSFSASFSRNVGHAQSIDYSEDVNLTYSLRWDLNEDFYARVGCSWLYSNDVSDNILFPGETTQTLTPSIIVGYTFSKKLSGYLEYRRNMHDSDLNAIQRDYTRDRFTLGIRYDI